MIKNKEMPLKNQRVYNHRQPVKIFIILRGLEDSTKSDALFSLQRVAEFGLCQANM